MDQRERLNDHEEVIRIAWDGFAANLWSALPGIIQSFDAVHGTCVVQPAIKPRLVQKDGTIQVVPIKELVDVPVVFLGGGGLVVTFPIQPGDECLLIFGSRCIDAWWQSGGTQPQADVRYHDLSDAFALIGPRSQINLIPNISTTTAQIRNLAGTAYIELTGTGAVNIVAPGGLSVNGNQSNTGTITATGEGTFNGGHTVSHHTHSDPQGGSTGLPTG